MFLYLNIQVINNSVTPIRLTSPTLPIQVSPLEIRYWLNFTVEIWPLDKNSTFTLYLSTIVLSIKPCKTFDDEAEKNVGCMRVRRKQNENIDCLREMK